MSTLFCSTPDPGANATRSGKQNVLFLLAKAACVRARDGLGRLAVWIHKALPVPATNITHMHYTTLLCLYTSGVKKCRGCLLAPPAPSPSNIRRSRSHTSSILLHRFTMLSADQCKMYGTHYTQRQLTSYFCNSCCRRLTA